MIVTFNKTGIVKSGLMFDDGRGPFMLDRYELRIDDEVLPFLLDRGLFVGKEQRFFGGVLYEGDPKDFIEAFVKRQIVQIVESRLKIEI